MHKSLVVSKKRFIFTVLLTITKTTIMKSMTVKEIYEVSDNFAQFETATGLTQEDAKKYWSEFSKINLENVMTNLSTTLNTIKEIQKKSDGGEPSTNLYVNDDNDGADWYFSLTGWVDTKYYSMTVFKMNDKVWIAQADCVDISIEEILSK